MRILVTRLRFLGDIVLSTPLLQALRDEVPDARIEYLASAPYAEVLQGHPCIDRLHVLAAQPGAGDLLRLLRALRAGPRIDWAIDLFSNPRSALILALSGARQRVGSDRGLRGRLYQHRRQRPAGDRSAIRHHLDRLVPMLGQLPAPGPTRLFADAARTDRLLDSLGLAGGQFTLIHPGSTWPEKAWPAQRWPELMSGLRDQGQMLVVLPPGEEDMAAEVARAGGGKLLPALSIADLSCLLTRAGLYVGNDGGVMHMAVAHQVPTVGLFGPTEPDIWFPYTQTGPYRVLGGIEGPEDDGLARLAQVSVDMVQLAIDEVLAIAAEGQAR